MKTKQLSVSSALCALIKQGLLQLSFSAVLFGLGVLAPPAQAEIDTVVTVGAVPITRWERSLNDDRVACYSNGPNCVGTTGNFLRSALLDPAHFGDAGSVVPNKCFSAEPVGSESVFLAADLVGLDAFSINFHYGNLTISEAEAVALYNFVLAGGYLFVHVNFNSGIPANVLTNKFGVEFDPVTVIAIPNGDYTHTEGITDCEAPFAPPSEPPATCPFLDTTGADVAGKAYFVASDAYTLITRLGDKATPLIKNQTTGKVWAATIAPDELGTGAGGVFFWGNETNETLGRPVAGFITDTTRSALAVHLNAFNAIPGQPGASCDGDPDTDGDGVPDDQDICPGGDDNVDGDGDLTPDFCDDCPADFYNDSDGDGVCDSVDICLGDDANGDSDLDGLCNESDPCIGASNSDADSDGICDEGDLCQGDDATGNADGDGVCNDLDACNGDDDSGDTDSDGTCDDIDACPLDVENDADGDGICEVDDNCDVNANYNQLDNDLDDIGDVCDVDDDNDGVGDDADNCPLAANADQTDFDGDGAGDVCDTDDDNDGVLDADDQCLATEIGAIVNADGCSIANLCPCDNNWKNHGAYVKCVAHTANDFVELGLISDTEHDDIVSAAGQSSCGAKQ